MKTFSAREHCDSKCFANQVEFSGILFWKKTQGENSDLMTFAESSILIFHFATNFPFNIFIRYSKCYFTVSAVVIIHFKID